MRAWQSLVIYLAVVFAGGALLAPGLYHLAQAAAPHSPALASLAANPFHRFVHRAMLGLALLGLWPLLRSWGLRTVADWGLALPDVPGRARAGFRLAGRGFLLGFLSLLGVALPTLLFGARTINLTHPAAAWFEYLAGALTAAVVVAWLEEILFRGAVFGGLRRASPRHVALAVSSLLYALVHFLARPEPPASVTWTTGLELLPRMLRGMADPAALVPGFFSLALAGAILALAYERTGSLYGSIGLHAGWIFWVKSYGFMTREAAGHSPWFWGSAKMIDGWLAFLALAVVLATFHRWVRPPAGSTGGRP